MKLKSHPISWVPTVYFAMGLPFVALAQASSLMFKNMGITDTQILLAVYHLKALHEERSNANVQSLKQGIETLKDVAITFFQKKAILLSLLVMASDSWDLYSILCNKLLPENTKPHIMLLPMALWRLDL